MAKKGFLIQTCQQFFQEFLKKCFLKVIATRVLKNHSWPTYTNGNTSLLLFSISAYKNCFTHLSHRLTCINNGGFVIQLLESIQFYLQYLPTKKVLGQFKKYSSPMYHASHKCIFSKLGTQE